MTKSREGPEAEPCPGCCPRALLPGQGGELRPIPLASFAGDCAGCAAAKALSPVPSQPVTGPPRRRSPPPRAAPPACHHPTVVRSSALGPSPGPPSIGAPHGGFGAVWGAGPPQPRGARGAGAGAEAGRARAVPGVGAGTGLCRRDRTGPGFAETAGSGARGRAGLSHLTGRDCLRRCHPARGQDRARLDTTGGATPCPPRCPRSRSAGHRGWGILSPPSPGMCPLSPQPWGSQHPRGRAAGPGLPCPFPALAEAGHYRPRPSQAAAPGRAPAAYL